MNEGWARFWERLIVDAVVVVVLAFVFQGLWFGIAAFLASWQPAWEGGLRAASGPVVALWLVATLTGLTLAVLRAWASRSAEGPRR